MYERVAGRCKKAWLCVPLAKFRMVLGPWVPTRMGWLWLVSRPKKIGVKKIQSYKK